MKGDKGLMCTLMCRAKGKWGDKELMCRVGEGRQGVNVQGYVGWETRS